MRPNLTPRDRSLVTISALIATGQVAQLGGHLNRAMDNGLTQAEAAEAITQLAFYAGERVLRLADRQGGIREAIEVAG